MKKAMYYEKLKDDVVRCKLCPWECSLQQAQQGICRGRVNYTGQLYSTNYAQVSSIALDPIEKKPLYHFYPGTQILSVGTVGCNLLCKFCQNWSIAHKQAWTEEVESEKLVSLAQEYDSLGIAFTYSEPLVWYEFVLETAQLMKGAGFKTVLVTNGLIHKEPLRELLLYIDAINLDIKAFRQDFYQKICGGGDLEVIKSNAALMNEQCHLEVTTLLIPGLNDEPHEVRELVQWLSGLNPDIPLHFSRYFPQYELELPPTPLTSLERAKEIAEQNMHYVYLGNVSDADRTTYCHHCHYPVVKRTREVQVDLDQGFCPECGTRIPIVW